MTRSSFFSSLFSSSTSSSKVPPPPAKDSVPPTPRKPVRTPPTSLQAGAADPSRQDKLSRPSPPHANLSASVPASFAPAPATGSPSPSLSSAQLDQVAPETPKKSLLGRSSRRAARVHASEPDVPDRPAASKREIETSTPRGRAVLLPFPSATPATAGSTIDSPAAASTVCARGQGQKRAYHYQLARLSREAASLSLELDESADQSPARGRPRSWARASSLALLFSSPALSLGRKASFDALSSSPSRSSRDENVQAAAPAPAPDTPSRRAMDQSRSDKDQRYDELHALISLIEGSPRPQPQRPDAPAQAQSVRRRRAGAQHTSKSSLSKSIWPSETEGEGERGPASLMKLDRRDGRQRSGSLFGLGLLSTPPVTAEAARKSSSLESALEAASLLDSRASTDCASQTPALRRKGSLPILSLGSLGRTLSPRRSARPEELPQRYLCAKDLRSTGETEMEALRLSLGRSFRTRAEEGLGLELQLADFTFPARPSSLTRSVPALRPGPAYGEASWARSRHASIESFASSWEEATLRPVRSASSTLLSEADDDRVLRELIDAFPSPKTQGSAASSPPVSMLTFSSSASDHEGEQVRTGDTACADGFAGDEGREREAAVHVLASMARLHRCPARDCSPARKVLRQYSLSRRPSIARLAAWRSRRNDSLGTLSFPSVEEHGRRENENEIGWKDDDDGEEESRPFYLEDDQLYWPQILAH